MSRTKKSSNATAGNDSLPANKQKGKKICTCCHENKNLTAFYLSYSPMYSLDQRVPICKECCKSSALNDEGSINYSKLKELLMQLDKPLYWDQLNSAFESVKKENSYLSDEETELHGYDILSKYFTFIAMRQDRAKSWSDAEKEGFIHTNTNRSKTELEAIRSKFAPLFHITNQTTNTSINQVFQSSNSNTSSSQNQLIYSDEWMGEYTQQDLDRLNKYYESLNTDYKIVTVNHRDYARKIAKASLMMDKAYEDMLKGVPGAEKMYTNAKDIFDSLSKSAKFSEDKRSINDVGISSFSKIVSMVENHNWIPEYVPKNKDMYDELLDELRVINRSL